MRYVTALTLAIALFSPLAGTAYAQQPGYEVEYTNEKPLIVLRFNQPRVAYEQPLYNTISRALSAKPSVMFDIVSVAPRAKDAPSQARANQIATQNTRKVLATLQEMGLPQSRINLTSVLDAVESSEVRIFVR